MAMCQMCGGQIVNAIDWYCTPCKKNVAAFTEEIEQLKKRVVETTNELTKAENTLMWVRYQHLYGKPMLHEADQDCVFCSIVIAS